VAIVDHVAIGRTAVLKAIQGGEDTGCDVVLKERSARDFAAEGSEGSGRSIQVAVRGLNHPAHGDVAVLVAVQAVERAVDLGRGIVIEDRAAAVLASGTGGAVELAIAGKDDGRIRILTVHSGRWHVEGMEHGGFDAGGNIQSGGADVDASGTAEVFSVCRRCCKPGIQPGHAFAGAVRRRRYSIGPGTASPPRVKASIRTGTCFICLQTPVIFMERNARAPDLQLRPRV
jgi:hypothetical protein